MSLRKLLISGVAAAAILVGVTACEEDAKGPTRPMCFPVIGKVTWSDTYGAARGGGRKHAGQDLLGTKLQKLVATVDGTITVLQHDHATAGNYLYLKDKDGWIHAYMHINNDTPGTDDGANPPAWVFAPGLKKGSTVKKGQLLGYLGDSGNAEDTTPHLHYELRKPDGSYSGIDVNPYNSLTAASTCAAT